MFKSVVFALALSMIVDVCGYKRAGKGNSLPANIKTIAIPVFQNSSLKYRVEQRFTQAVIDEILKRALLQILLFADKQVKRLDSPAFNLASKLLKPGSGVFLFKASAHRPSISVETIVCAKSFAMRSTAGFCSLKNDCGSSES